MMENCYGALIWNHVMGVQWTDDFDRSCWKIVNDQGCVLQHSKEVLLTAKNLDVLVSYRFWAKHGFIQFHGRLVEVIYIGYLWHHRMSVAEVCYGKGNFAFLFHYLTSQHCEVITFVVVWLRALDQLPRGRWFEPPYRFVITLQQGLF